MDNSATKPEEAKKNEGVAQSFAKDYDWDKEKGYRKFTLPGQFGATDPIELHVNWNSAPEIAGCKSIKLVGRTKSGETFETIVKFEDLMSLMFLLGDKTAQQSMIQPKVFKTKQREMIVTHKASRDYRKGEPIKFQLWVTLNAEEEVARHSYANMQDVRRFTK